VALWRGSARAPGTIFPIGPSAIRAAVEECPTAAQRTNKPRAPDHPTGIGASRTRRPASPGPQCPVSVPGAVPEPLPKQREASFGMGVQLRRETQSKPKLFPRSSLRTVVYPCKSATTPSPSGIRFGTVNRGNQSSAPIALRVSIHNARCGNPKAPPNWA
jgi:hypothetical protein